MALVTMARSLREAEQRTGELSARHGEWHGIAGRIADNTLGRVLSQLRLAALLACLHRLVKAEHRRGNLEPTRLPFGTVAIDGKHVATLRWRDLCRAVDLKPDEASIEEVRAQFAARYPEAQLCEPEDGEPYALVRMHTATLVSADASVCIHVRPIEGHTNEVGSMPVLLEELKAAYCRTRLFELVTTDAGNTSLKAAGKAVELGLSYFCQIKSIHGDLYTEAKQTLGGRRMARARASYSDKQNGQLVTYYAWRQDLGDTGFLDWTHARQLVRVRRVAEDLSTGETISTGDRYDVSSLPVRTLVLRRALDISRAHWRCENGTHWTSDAELGEDRRQLSWSRPPHGVLVVTALRMMALAILAVARQMTRLGYSKETPSWAQVAGHFRLRLCGSILETSAFDEV